MIKLTTLLLETIKKPKCIFITGPAGSGKSYIADKILPKSFELINIDKFYEELLKQSGLGLDQKDFNLTQNSTAGKLMGQAVTLSKLKFIDYSKLRENIIIDSTGASSKTLLQKKQFLENLGYECIMLMIYVSPIVALERNIQRTRSLMPSIILKTWYDVNTNIDVYKQEFGDNFILYNNDPKELPSKNILTYFQDSQAENTFKTEEDKAKHIDKTNQLIQNITSLPDVKHDFTSLEQVKDKINNFIK